jgi:hypothetical protein
MEFILWLWLFVYQPAAVHQAGYAAVAPRETVGLRIPVQKPVLPRPVLR